MEELKKLFEKQAKAFEDFKEANDQRIKEIESKGAADPVLEEKIKKLNEQISDLSDEIKELQKKAGRPGAGSNGDDPDAVTEHKKAFYDGFIRKGREDGLKELEAKAVNIGTPGEGGYAVPIEQDREILSLMRDESPMRSLCRVLTKGTPEYKKLVNLGGADHGWVGETDERPATGTPGLAQVTPYWGEVYANPQATQESLDDMFFDVEAWLREEVASDFAEDESACFVTGNGVKKPRGFLDYPSVATADASRAFGTIEHKAAAAVAAVTTNELIGLIHKFKRKFRKGSLTWQFNGLTLEALRKLKNSDGDYIWRPGMSEKEPSLLFGYPYEENGDMPDMSAGETPIAIGDWKRAYYIIDRIGIRSLRDPYTNKPFVGFYTTKRVGGMLVDSEAVKLLKMADG